MAVFVLLLALALLGAAVAQVVDYPDWQFFGTLPAGATLAGQVQRFFAKGLVPLFAGVALLIYGISLWKGHSHAEKSTGTAPMSDDTEDLLRK